MAIGPFLHGGVVLENHWLTEEQFIDALALAMITPGPVVITVGFIGYLVGGFWGASVASLATFLPCYLFTIIPAPYFKKISKISPIKAFVDGITATVVGALMGLVFVITSRSIKDIFRPFQSPLRVYLSLSISKIKEPVIIIISAIVGLIIKIIL